MDSLGLEVWIEKLLEVEIKASKISARLGGVVVTDGFGGGGCSGGFWSGWSVVSFVVGFDSLEKIRC